MKPYTDPETGLRAWIPRDPSQQSWIIRVIHWIVDRIQEARHAADQ